MKPIVDLIGDEESCESSLASCMLGLIRLAKTISQLPLEDGDSLAFWLHAKAVFNHHFFAMNTEIHSLALFLHPMCRKLAISQAANGHSFKFMVKVALDIAKQWRWSEQCAKTLVTNLKEYHKCSGVFVGAQADALDWWETLPVSAERCQLKAFAIIIHSIVPHAADVERYFSGLGGVQSTKRCNLSVNTFESLSKLCANYANFLHTMDREAGKSIRRNHAHMHTRPELGLDPALTDQLQRSFAWVPPLGASDESDDDFLGPESITDEELLAEFDQFERDMTGSSGQQGLSGNPVPGADDGLDVFADGVIDWNELEKVNKGITPAGFMEEIDVVSRGSEDMESGWNIDALLASEGVASMY